MPKKTRRDAAAAMLARDPSFGDSEGWSAVESVVSVLIAGIVAAIVIFAVASATDHSSKTANQTTATTTNQPTTSATESPAARCEDERAMVDVAIQSYKAHFHSYPASLLALVPKFLNAAPSAKSPSGAAGYRYNATNGKYSGGNCPDL